MKLTDILSPQSVRVPLNAQDKTGVITELVDLLAGQGLVTDRDEVLQAVLSREATRSTGIGYGLAIPHGKCVACPQLVMAVGKPSVGVEFESIDGRPVDVIVLLTSPPDQTGPHIQALARISRLMMIEDFRRRMREATTAAEVYNIIREHEEQSAVPQVVN